MRKKNTDGEKRPYKSRPQTLKNLCNAINYAILNCSTKYVDKEEVFNYYDSDSKTVRNALKPYDKDDKKAVRDANISLKYLTNSHKLFEFDTEGKCKYVGKIPFTEKDGTKILEHVRQLTVESKQRKTEERRILAEERKRLEESRNLVEQQTTTVEEPVFNEQQVVEILEGVNEIKEQNSALDEEVQKSTIQTLLNFAIEYRKDFETDRQNFRLEVQAFEKRKAEFEDQVEKEVQKLIKAYAGLNLTVKSLDEILRAVKK